MCDEHERCLALLFVLLLHHFLDGNVLPAEHGSDLGEHARFVVHRQAKIIGALEVRDELDILFRRRVVLKGRVLVFGVRCGIDDVADDRAARGECTGAPAVEHDVVHGIARQIDGVEAVVDGGKRMLPFDEGGVYAHFDPLFRLFADRKEFEAVAELLAVRDVVLRDRRDPFAEYLGEGNLRVEGERREDGELIGRIEAFDVGRRVGLRIAERLCFLENVRIVCSVVGHLGEDVVGRPVDDAHHGGNMVGLHTVEEGADDGDAAYTACLEIEPCVVALGGSFKFMGILADELLVGGNDGLARVQRVKHKFARLADAAHDFHNDVDVGIGDDFCDVGCDDVLGDAERFNAVPAEFEDADDLQIDVLRLLIELPVLFQDLVGAAADDPQPENGNSDFFHIIPPNCSNRISTSGRRA